jgi:hypothetical protein
MVPVDVKQQEAIDLALNNRLDLMNQRASVVDSWRKIKVAADALQADLDVIVEGEIHTEQGSKNPLDFSARASSHRVGVRLDGPLNRMAERNRYRAQLIQYQRERRDFIARRDAIVQAVRRDIRDLATGRVNFEITRQSLIAAARQVELARVQLLAPSQSGGEARTSGGAEAKSGGGGRPPGGGGGGGGDSSSTQDVLRALDAMLTAKNALIATWVAYETGRLKLLLDTEALQLDERGLPAQTDPSPPLPQ